MSTSISLLAIFAPSCWSPPKGPDLSIVISKREFEASLQRRSISVSATMRPVVPVHIRRCDKSFSQFQATHSARSCFMASCATSDIVNLFSILFIILIFLFFHDAKIVLDCFVVITVVLIFGYKKGLHNSLLYNPML